MKLDSGLIVHTDDESASAIMFCLGDLDLNSGAALTFAVRNLDPRTETIIFDLRDVAFVDAAGMRPIATAIKLFGRNSVSIREPTTCVQRILELIEFASNAAERECDS